ncbi:MarR family transcriptional regulator [Rhodobacter sp. SGA-6-6]|nr:MarR family transcriptional regulator [Rhodobacter sp. SGA-6-6]
MTGISDLQAHRGYWLRMVSNAVSQSFARQMADQGVTVAEWVFLRVLHDAEAMAPSSVAEAMAMTRGAISKISTRLEAKGLVQRTGNAQDRRGQTLSLTAEGRAKVPVLAGIADRNDADFFGVLTAEEAAALDRVLAALVARRGLRDVPVD